MFLVEPRRTANGSSLDLWCELCAEYIEIAQHPKVLSVSLKDANTAAIAHYAQRHEGVPTDAWPSPRPVFGTTTVGVHGLRPAAPRDDYPDDFSDHPDHPDNRGAEPREGQTR